MMEFASLLLLILLPAADAGTDMTAAVQAALYRDLGQVAIAVVPDTPRSRRAWQEPNGDFRAKYVTRFSWVGRHKARVELWRGQGVGQAKDRIGTRELTFSPADATAERGRALGLVVVQLLRELPEADLIMPKPKPAVVLVAAPPKPDPAPPAHAAVALLSLGRAAPGVWAYGPEILVGLPVRPRLCAQASIAFAQGSANGYGEFGLTLGAAYSPWQSADRRHGVGAALRVGMYRETAQTGHEPPVTVKHWAFAVIPQVVAYVGVWRHVRLQGGIGVRRDTGTFSTSVGEDNQISNYAYAAWRPTFSLGIGLAF